MHAAPLPTRIGRRSLLFAGVATALGGCAGNSLAVGRWVDVEIVDRETGQVLEAYFHRGRHYVAGQPGARYAIRISNRSGGRVLAVTAVDGINVVSGESATWGQTGYVFAAGHTHDLTGWRKSDQQVAAFAFTSLPDSYAARTGRPQDVGVIGVAVFRERVQPVPLSLPGSAPESRDGSTRRQSGAAAPAEKAANDTAEPARSRLGTAHGEREPSPVTHTAFERASATPDDIVTVQYDRYENLLAAGIVGPRRGPRPRPFPGSGDGPAYVPDPPY